MVHILLTEKQVAYSESIFNNCKLFLDDVNVKAKVENGQGGGDPQKTKFFPEIHIFWGFLAHFGTPP